MTFNIADIFSKIPQQTFEEAVRGGFLLAAAISTFYLFFGKIFSLPQLIGSSIKTPIQNSKNTITIISGFIFISSLIRTLYHEHLTSFYPFDQQQYFNKMKLLRLIICGSLVGFGTQLASIDQSNRGSHLTPTFSLRSLLSFVNFFGAAMLAFTYKWSEYIPDTPRILNILNSYLPRNISYESYLLVGLLIPFICFLISTKKSLKGLIQSLILFGIGIALGCCLLLLGWSKIESNTKVFKYSAKWTGQYLVVYGIGSLIFSFVHLIVKYVFRKPLFSNVLHDKKYLISYYNRTIIGNIIAGLGFGMAGISLQGFLLTIPSSSLRILVFWGIPCIIFTKLAQLIIPSSQQQKKSE